MRSKWGRRYISLSESLLSNYGFVTTFVGLYIILNLLLFLNGVVTEVRRHEDIRRYTTSIARGAGATLNLNMGVVVFLASRAALNFLRKTPISLVLPIDKAMPDLHRIVGILIVFASITHSIAHVITYTVQSPWRPGFGEATHLFVTGIVLLCLIILIRIAARSGVYHSNYEVFFRVHVGGAVLAYGFLFIHGIHRGSLSSWKWVIGPVAIYVLDVTFRGLKQKRSFLLVSKHAAAFQGPDVLKIRLPRVFHFEAGQYAELKVPLISRLQWHPFTIASAPHEPEMVFYIKAVGDWTISLYQLFGERINGENQEDIEVHIRGPYGAPAQHVGQFERVILVGGGVGATPFCAVVKDTHNWITNWTPRPQRQSRPSHPSLDQKGYASIPGGAVQTTHSSRSTVNASSQNRRPVPLYSADRVEKRQGEHVNESGSSSSHIFTTNVYSEHFDSLGVLEDITIPARVFRDRLHARRNREALGSRPGSSQNPRALSKHTRTRNLSSYTARDYLRNDDCSSASGNQSNIEIVETSFLEEHEDSEVDIIAHDGTDDVQAPSLLNTRGHPNMFRRSTQPIVNADGMGSYYENSMGTVHRSLDYMTALHSLYDEPSTNHAVYRQSLDLMVAMSFGSATFVRNMQRRKALVEMRRSVDRLPTAIGAEDLSLFHSNRVMFLLFMKSVTMNMILLWILLVRYVVFGVGFIFGFIDILHEGIVLYESQALNAIDFVLIIVVTSLIAIPAFIEAMELGLESTQGFDFFVVLPLVLIDTVVSGLSLANTGENIPLFTLLRVSIGWPIQSILILVRLFRVIGERVALAQNLAVDPYTTKEVDFYWTAPTPEDDRWLVKELRPYANIDAVRLHRYLTRCHKSDNRGNRTILRNARSLYTNCGRPDWEEIMNEMAEQCPNNSTVGVFFCGPRAMGEQVQKACMSAMRNSIVRGLHAGADNMRELEEVFGDAIPVNQYTGELPRPRGEKKGGSNVKIVFKRETFS